MAASNHIPSADDVRRLFNYDPETGVLTWRVTNSNRARKGSIAGSHDGNGYLQVRFMGKKYRVHRVVFLHFYGRWPDMEIDHINGNRSDNRIANLRDVSRSVNQQNMRSALSNNKTGVLGVSVINGKYMAFIQTNGKSHYLGGFETEEEAQSAYLSAKRNCHEGCTI